MSGLIITPSERPEQLKGINLASIDNPFMQLEHIDSHPDSVIDVLHPGPLGPFPLILERLIKHGTPSAAIESGAAFLDSMPWSSFPQHVTGEAVAKHSGSFVGRDYKIFIQIAPSFTLAIGKRLGSPRFRVHVPCVWLAQGHVLWHNQASRI